MKYIDAEKLIAQIEKQMKDVEIHSDLGEPDDLYYDGRRSILVMLRSFITSLQQEQSRKIIKINGIRYKEVPAKTDDKICKECDYFLDNGCCNLDDCPCTCADNILERIQQEQPDNEEKIMNFFDALGDCGFSQHDILLLKNIWKEAGCPPSKSQVADASKVEQPEVDFEKEYKSYMQSRKDDISGNTVTVNMKDLARHFWNKGYNARKEE